MKNPSIARTGFAFALVATICMIGAQGAFASGNAGRINGLVQSEVGSCLAAWEVAGYSVEEHGFGYINYASFVFHAVDSEGNHVLNENGFPLNIAIVSVAWAGNDYWVQNSSCLPAP